MLGPTIVLLPENHTMTDKLYWDNETLEANVQVLQCQPLADGRFGIILNATPFHPQGGGQPADQGLLGGLEVLGVELVAQEVVHYLPQALAVGPVFAQVQGLQRQLHSRLHSAGHLIGHVMELQHWRPIKAQHWPTDARVVFKPIEQAQPLDADAVQRLCDEQIALGLPRHVHINEQQFRQVGFGDFAPYGCGGTHVASTAQLQGLQVQSVQSKKGQLTVHYRVV